MALKAGDRVRIASRSVTAEDEKTGLYYSYFGGLTGTIDTIYRDGSVCVNVDLESLSAEARDRHLEMQEAERKKWLDGLSAEVRSRLTPEQKQLALSYKVLVSKDDLQTIEGGKSKGEKKNAKQPADPNEDAAPSADKGPARAPGPKHVRGQEDEPAPHRPSAEELAKAEEEYLKSLQKES